MKIILLKDWTNPNSGKKVKKGRQLDVVNAMGAKMIKAGEARPFGIADIDEEADPKPKPKSKKK